MKTLKKRLIILVIAILTVSACLSVSTVAMGEEESVYLGGMITGFEIDNKGATVIGVNDVITKEGLKSPSRDAEIAAGDLLLSLDGKEINSARDIEIALSDYDGNGITAVLERKGEVIIKIIYPAYDITGKYRVGLFIRDGISGIGTVTYVREDGRFGALGHPVVEGESQRIVKINSGKVFNCCVTGIKRGEQGVAGEIRGCFISDRSIGKIDSNTSKGLFGTIEEREAFNNCKKINLGTAKPGKAKLYSAVCGDGVCSYDVNIVKYDGCASENKNIVLKITDERLLDYTGGILQGMSGSPIVQDGRLVGAVTHVFINDPTRGFGISIANMMDE